MVCIHTVGATLQKRMGCVRGDFDGKIWYRHSAHGHTISVDNPLCGRTIAVLDLPRLFGKFIGSIDIVKCMGVVSDSRSDGREDPAWCGTKMLATNAVLRITNAKDSRI